MSDYSANRTGSAEAGKASDLPFGRVALVGAGPGDPDLLTIKAARLIAAAEVVFVDRLVGKGVMDLVSPAAEIVSVGKSKGEHSVPQDEIHHRMIEAAKAGKKVVRLKGGDPFIFGRGGEEVEALRAAGIEVEVVPGISAALGVAAVTQIPLTHRDAAQAVTFVTGHAALGKEPDLDWTALARPNQTVVVFMGVGTADVIAARLIAAGRDPATPVAIVENGTRENEVRAFSALGNVADAIQAAGIQGPALLVIGEVVALAQREAGAQTTVAAQSKPSLSSLWKMLS
jgi:uroporphyrin-III C-methyltransferase